MRKDKEWTEEDEKEFRKWWSVVPVGEIVKVSDYLGEQPKTAS